MALLPERDQDRRDPTDRPSRMSLDMSYRPRDEDGGGEDGSSLYLLLLLLWVGGGSHPPG